MNILAKTTIWTIAIIMGFVLVFKIIPAIMKILFFILIVIGVWKFVQGKMGGEKPKSKNEK